MFCGLTALIWGHAMRMALRIPQCSYSSRREGEYLYRATVEQKPVPDSLRLP